MSMWTDASCKAKKENAKLHKAHLYALNSGRGFTQFRFEKWGILDSSDILHIILSPSLKNKQTNITNYTGILNGQMLHHPCWHLFRRSRIDTGRQTDKHLTFISCSDVTSSTSTAKRHLKYLPRKPALGRAERDQLKRGHNCPAQLCIMFVALGVCVCACLYSIGVFQEDG